VFFIFGFASYFVPSLMAGFFPCYLCLSLRRSSSSLTCPSLHFKQEFHHIISAAAAVEVHNYENITGSQKVHISFQTTACLEDDSIIIIIIPSPHLTSQN
jgi:hypothetical protein